MNPLWIHHCLLTFFKIIFFQKKIFKEHYQSDKQFGSISGKHSVSLDLDPNCKGFQQTTKVTASKKRVKTIPIIRLEMNLASGIIWKKKFHLMADDRITQKYRPSPPIKTAWAISMESALGCTLRVYFDNITLMLQYVTLTSQKP